PNSGGGGGGGDGDAGGSGGGNGGGGGGGNGDGGGPGGGGGGGDGNDPLAAPGQYPASAPDQWQLNPKLNISILPAWDGKGDTVIDYVIAMAYLAVLSPRMAQGIAQLAPSKFTGRAERWWTTLPLDRRAEFSMDWDHLLDAIRRQFLTAQWLFERTREFEEAHFRQKGHSDEEPLDFFQRRVRWHAFLFSDVADGPPAIARIIRTQPVEWFKDVNERVCPDIDTLMNYAEHNKASLLSAWVLAHRVEALMSGPSASTHAAPFRRRRANAADKVVDFIEDSDDDEPETEESKVVMAADRERRRGTPRDGTSGPKKPWPGGKTVNGYSFQRDDSKVSARLPNGECYICTSPKHVYRDCPHYSKWTALRSANLIYVDLDPEVEARDLQEYVAMLVESTPTSTYSSDEPESEIRKEVSAVEALGRSAKAAHVERGGMNRNQRRREANTRFSTIAKGKGKAVKRDDPPSIPRRELRKASRSVELSYTTDEDGRRIFAARKGRQLPDGLGSLGSRALHVKVRVGSLLFQHIKGRMDSGSDITLMSEDFWKSVPGLPKPREGMRMALYHLTGQAKVLGYIKTTLYMVTKEDEVISFELEAYVVRNMKVPLLLGEDFQ
ncbi:hypothetical protein B0H12DRAFT_962742, partial [Mycena haematopus]